MRTTSDAVAPMGVPTEQSTLDSVRALVAEVLEQPIDAITGTTAIVDGVDSMSLIDISVRIEEQFDVALPDLDELRDADVKTVGDLATLVGSLRDEVN